MPPKGRPSYVRDNTAAAAAAASPTAILRIYYYEKIVQRKIDDKLSLRKFFSGPVDLGRMIAS